MRLSKTPRCGAWRSFPRGCCTRPDKKKPFLERENPRCDFLPLGAGWVKPGIKKRLREHGSLQPFLQNQVCFAQFSSLPLTLRSIVGRRYVLKQWPAKNQVKNKWRNQLQKCNHYKGEFHPAAFPEQGAS
jgi:hypothetical protein